MSKAIEGSSDLEEGQSKRHFAYDSESATPAKIVAVVVGTPGGGRELMATVVLLWFLHCPVLHVAVDVGVELSAGEDTVEASGLGGGEVLLVDVRTEGDELDRGEAFLK